MTFARVCQNRTCKLGWRLAATALAFALLLPTVVKAEDDLWAGAADRIEKHRKSDVIVTVHNANGEPVENAVVEYEQTRHAFLFGCNIYRWGRFDDPNLEQAYRQQFAELLNFATIGFYWASYEREQGKPQHEYAEDVARWCQEQGIATKGHPLAWNYADPQWLPDDPDEILRLQLDRISDCVSRFAGLIDRWDVVNEATHFDRPDFVERRAPKFSRMWQQVGRVEFARRCFETARDANPEAVLLINDYRTDPEYEKVIEGLVDDDGQPLYDVIGIQSHMHGGTWSNEKIWEVCERFSRFDVPLHFTETTIVSGERGQPWETTPEGEEYQAKEVVRFYTMLFSHPAVEAITWWDFSDSGAWQGAPAGLVRKDMSPKPAYKELRRLVKDEWWSRGKLNTDAQGQATARIFQGDYRVTVTAEDGQATVALRVGKGRNQFIINLPSADGGE